MGVGEAPLNAFTAAKAEEIADGRAEIDPRTGVAVWQGRLVPENVLPVIGLEGANVLPLSIANFAVVVKGGPAAFADGDAIPAIIFPEPRSHRLSLRPMFSARSHVIVGQRDVK